MEDVLLIYPPDRITYARTREPSLCASEGEALRRKEYPLPLGNYYIGPAGGVRVSVPDLAKFMMAHMNGGIYEGVRILKNHTVNLMHQMHWYGFAMEGFFRHTGLSFHITDALAGRRLTGHAGEAYGLVSDMFFNRNERTGVIFITNGGYFQFLSRGFTDIEEAVINMLYEYFAGSPKPALRIVTAGYGDIKLTANGRRVFYPVSPDIKAGDFYVPAITLADALETQIEYNPHTLTLTLAKGGYTISAKVREAFLQANGQEVQLVRATYINNGYIMLPLIQVSRLFGATVSYSSLGSAIAVLLRDDAPAPGF